MIPNREKASHLMNDVESQRPKLVENQRPMQGHKYTFVTLFHFENTPRRNNSLKSTNDFGN